MRRELMLVAGVVLLSGSVAGAAGEPSGVCAQLDPLDHEDTVTTRTDHRASGNRVAVGCGPLDGGDHVDVQVGMVPDYVVAEPGAQGTSWILTSRDGAVMRVSIDDDDRAMIDSDVVGTLAAGEPPIAEIDVDTGRTLVSGALERVGDIDDVLPGSRLVQAQDGSTVALTGPTQRYAHGVLGDHVEASAVTVLGADGGLVRAELHANDVIEGDALMLVDLDDDGSEEIVVTVSNERDGARLVAYDLDGKRVAAGEPIGQGFRWMHQIGGGPLGPSGETEIVAVRTPHIGGIVEAYRLIDGELRRVASRSGFSSHRYGSTNLDMALLADVDGNGRLDVVVPTDDMRTLGVLTRVDDTFEIIDPLPLDGRLATNVATSADDDGRLVIAVGTDDGRLRIFR